MKKILYSLFKTFIKFFRKLKLICLQLNLEFFFLANKQLIIIIFVNELLFFYLDISYLQDME